VESQNSHPGSAHAAAFFFASLLRIFAGVELSVVDDVEEESDDDGVHGILGAKAYFPSLSSSFTVSTI